jgi:hypothetical protein
VKKLLISLGLASSISSCDFVACVARGTRVKTPRGERLIEELTVGDELVVVDPDTGMTAVSRISAITTSTRECGTLTFEDRKLAVTSDHPLYDPEVRAFFPAGDWLLGRRVQLLELGADGVRSVRVDAVEVYSRVDHVFDLTVEHEWHTFVAAGIVVHNKSPMVRECLGSDGGVIGREYDRCACKDGGTGALSCDEGTGRTAECVDCQAKDGGQ